MAAMACSASLEDAYPVGRCVVANLSYGLEHSIWARAVIRGPTQRTLFVSVPGRRFRFHHKPKSQLIIRSAGNMERIAKLLEE